MSLFYQKTSKRIYARIIKVQRKIVHLFALHANCELYKQHKDRLAGILDIVGGLEYHYNNMKRYERYAYQHLLNVEEALAKKSTTPLHQRDKKRRNYSGATHEAVAYSNRLGQLYYFFTSKWFTNIVLKSEIAKKIPTILALIPIRNKFSSHRQHDRPKDDDCTSLGLCQHGLLSGLSYKKNQPKTMHIEYQFPTNQRDKLLIDHWPNAVSNVERFGDNNNLIIFAPTRIHPIVLCECLESLERFFRDCPCNIT